MVTKSRKTIPVRFDDNQYDVLTHNYIQYMADTGLRLSLNTYIKLKLGLVEPVDNPQV
ncbi:hypothetical protein [Nostoc sp.]|uniref:hypothetical protein n=1 Tax=Nostoc sp. TaxID=1180 RepID=UPI002FFA5BEB